MRASLSDRDIGRSRHIDNWPISDDGSLFVCVNKGAELREMARWKIRGMDEAMEKLGAKGYLVRINFETRNMEFQDGKSISGNLLWDLPPRIKGKSGLMKNTTIQMLEDAIPGIAEALYEWFEPRSSGELIGELLSSWTGVPCDGVKETKEDA